MWLESVVIAILVIYLMKLYQNMKRLPPGPWGIPFIGYYPFISSTPTQQFSEFADKYGDLMTVNYFGENYYYLNGLQVVKDVIVKQTNYTIERPKHFHKHAPFSLAFGSDSLVSASGDAWKIQHKFMLSKLSELGVGKTELNHKISSLCENVVEFVQKTNGEQVDVYEILTNFTSNVISMILFSKTYAHDDPQYIRLRDDVREFFVCCDKIDGNLSGDLFNLYYRMKADFFKRCQSFKKRSIDYFKPIIEERIKMKKPGSQEYSDVLDFIVEKNIENAKYFDIETIAGNIFMWFVAGTETTSTTLYHAINLMIKHPEIQAKVQQEIDSVFGSDRPVSYQERHLLPYTQAVIQEVQRYACVIPFGISHSNSKELTVSGYTIPEKSSLIINIWKLSRDKREFKNPDNFDPNNFLTESGEFVKNDANMPFAAGKRMCIGANLSSMELFIGFVTLCQKFNWKPPNGETVKRDIFECQARVLCNFNCIANSRE